jgi:hypothetical protein
MVLTHQYPPSLHKKQWGVFLHPKYLPLRWEKLHGLDLRFLLIYSFLASLLSSWIIYHLELDKFLYSSLIIQFKEVLLKIYQLPLNPAMAPSLLYYPQITLDFDFPSEGHQVLGSNHL